MTLGQLAEQVQQRFREHLTGEKLYRALQWNIEQHTVPVGSERVPTISYMERMGLSAIEPNPQSTTQLSLGYTITQQDFVSPDTAAQLGVRALTERVPAQFGSKCEESITLGFHSKSQLVYTAQFDPSRDFPHREGYKVDYATGRQRFGLVQGDSYFTITDSSAQFSAEMERITAILSQPDKVLDVFVDRWIQGHR